MYEKEIGRLRKRDRKREREKAERKNKKKRAKNSRTMFFEQKRRTWIKHSKEEDIKQQAQEMRQRLRSKRSYFSSIHSPTGEKTI